MEVVAPENNNRKSLMPKILARGFCLVDVFSMVAPSGDMILEKQRINL
jgi:hypothetical protein